MEFTKQFLVEFSEFIAENSKIACDLDIWLEDLIYQACINPNQFELKASESRDKLPHIFNYRQLNQYNYNKDESWTVFKAVGEK